MDCHHWCWCWRLSVFFIQTITTWFSLKPLTYAQTSQCAFFISLITLLKHITTLWSWRFFLVFQQLLTCLYFSFVATTFVVTPPHQQQMKCIINGKTRQSTNILLQLFIQWCANKSLWEYVMRLLLRGTGITFICIYMLYIYMLYIYK